MYFTVKEEPAPAHVRYCVGGVGSCAPSPGVEPAPVLYRLGRAGSCASPIGRSRFRYFTAWEEPAHVLYRL